MEQSQSYRSQRNNNFPIKWEFFSLCRNRYFHDSMCRQLSPALPSKRREPLRASPKPKMSSSSYILETPLLPSKPFNVRYRIISWGLITLVVSAFAASRMRATHQSLSFTSSSSLLKMFSSTRHGNQYIVAVVANPPYFSVIRGTRVTVFGIQFFVTSFFTHNFLQNLNAFFLHGKIFFYGSDDMCNSDVSFHICINNSCLPAQTHAASLLCATAPK